MGFGVSIMENQMQKNMTVWWQWCVKQKWGGIRYQGSFAYPPERGLYVIELTAR